MRSLPLLTSFTTAAEQKNDLPAPAWVLGVVAFGLLTALLIVTLTFNRDR